MEFRLLGAVEAHDGDQNIDLGPPKQRLVLAVLAATPGRPVPRHVLIDRVWNDASLDARTSLYSYVSRLRAALGQSESIAKQADGYVLRAEPEQVDLTRFRGLVADARRRAAHEPEAALWQLKQAIGLWRGVPLADLDGSWVENTRNSLVQQRLDALVDLGELGLRLNRQRELVDLLTEWAEEFPLSEPLAALLMRALVRLGRRAEALAHFARVHEYLVAELGEGPGSALQGLHERILRRDPDLEHADQRTDEPAPAASRFRPAELPTGIPTFVGRLTEVDRLCTLLTQRQDDAVSMAAIAGGAGTGKSTLAVRVAHLVAGKFPGGVLYANLRGSTPGRTPADPIEVLTRFLRGCGCAENEVPATTEEASARFRSATAERRMLVLLDDALDAGQVRPLIPAGPGCAVLVTSRRVLATLDAATHLRLAGMTEADASELLVRMVGPGQLDDDARMLPVVRDVVRLCGRLPLAVRIAAARLTAHPEWEPAALVMRLSDARQRLDELHHAYLDVRASFAMSTAGLGSNLIRLFELLGLLDLEHITVPAAAAMAGESLSAAQAGVDALVEAQLLATAGPGRYELHDLMRLYARELAESSLDASDRAEAIQRGLHYYLATIRNAAGILSRPVEPRLSVGILPDDLRTAGSTFNSRTDAVTWVDAEAGNLLAAARQAIGTPGLHPVVVALSAAAAGPLNIRGQLRVLTELAVLAVRAAQTNQDDHGLAQAHLDVAIGLSATGPFEDALSHAEQALRIWSEAGVLVCQAAALNNIGILSDRLGDAPKALAHFERALDIQRQLGHAEAQGAILTNMSKVLAERAEFPEAFARLDEALSLYRAQGLSGGEGFVLGNIGKVHLRAGDPACAITCLEQAVQLVRPVRRSPFEAEFLWHLGAAHRALGRAEQALILQREALAIVERAGAITAEEARTILDHPSPETPHQFR